MRKLVLFIAVAAVTALLPTTVTAKCHKAECTKHTIKGGPGLAKVGHVLKAVPKAVFVTVPKDTVLGAYDTLEASVDAFGVSLQFFADTLDMGVAAPLEALPKPLNYIGDGVHYVYLGLDAAGTFLAK